MKNSIIEEIENSIDNNNYKLFQSLIIKNHNVIKDFEYFYFVQKTAGNDMYDFFIFLLNNIKERDLTSFCLTINILFKFKNKKAIHILIEKIEDFRIFDIIFINAIKNKILSVFTHLIKKEYLKKYLKEVNVNRFITYAINNNNIDTLKILMKKFHIKNINSQNFLRHEGEINTDMIVFLMKNKIFHSKEFFENISNNAIIFKHNNVINFLLSCNEINKVKLFYSAYSNDNIYVLSKLINTPNLNVHKNNNEIMRNAYVLKKEDIINILWENKLVKQTLRNDIPELFNSLIKFDIKYKLYDF